MITAFRRLPRCMGNPHARCGLGVETLEARLPLAVVVVSTTSDVTDGATGSIAGLISSPGADGFISLREAITAANNTPGPNVLHFSIGNGPKTINIASALPVISQPLEIRGDTQPGYADTPIVELNGISAGAAADGLSFTSSGNIVRGLVINRFGDDGLVFTASNSNVVAGNYIGTNIAGTVDLGNGGDGIVLSGGATGNTIGGTADTDRNVISGNNTGGIFIVQSSNNLIQGNYIGVAANGINDLGNTREGIVLQDAASNTVGGTDAAARNVISGNDTNGVVIFGTAAVNNVVQGNYIGTNAAGDGAIGNGVAGVLITGAAGGGSAASMNVIGGTQADAGNVISGNIRNGIELFSGAHDNRIQGNFIGTRADGLAAIANGGAGADPLGGFGIDITDASSNIIGGDDDDDGNADGIVAARNEISGNVMGGVRIKRAAAPTAG